MDDLENLALVGDGTKWTADQALATGDALIVVDLCMPFLVRADGIHAAGGLAGALQFDDGVIGTYFDAAAAFNALIVVDFTAPVSAVDGLFGTYLPTWVLQTVLTCIRNGDAIAGTGVAGVSDDVDQRRIIIFFGNGGLLNAVGDGDKVLDGPQRQADGQPKPLADDGALQKNTVPIACLVAGNDAVGELDDTGVVAALVGEAGDLLEHAPADFGEIRMGSS